MKVAAEQSAMVAGAGYTPGSRAARGSASAGRGRSRAVTVLIVLLALVGVLVMSYPFISSLANQRYADEAISSYKEGVADLADIEKEKMLDQAHSYNDSLRKSNVVMTDPFDTEAQKEASKAYEDTLNVDGHGLMAYVDIPSINVHLPIFHGVSSSVLERAVGHLQGTSVPVGGVSTHSVLSAHTGLPTATLFTELDKMQVGDLFKVTVLDEELWYRVGEVEVVLPSEVGSLKIEQGRDLCTLVTCTPYGVNSHRLLVHGERTDAPAEDVEAGGLVIDWRLILFALAMLLLVALVTLFVVSRVRAHQRKRRIAQQKVQLSKQVLGKSSDDGGVS